MSFCGESQVDSQLLQLVNVGLVEMWDDCDHSYKKKCNGELWDLRESVMNLWSEEPEERNGKISKSMQTEVEKSCDEL